MCRYEYWNEFFILFFKKLRIVKSLFLKLFCYLFIVFPP